MRYGVTLNWLSDVDYFQQTVVTAERVGFDLVATGDSPTVYREVTMSLALAAQVTNRVTLSSMVAVPTGRNPVVFASALAGLQELSGNRVVVATGTGASAASAIGAPAVTLEHLRDYIEALRALCAGENARWNGATLPARRHTRPIKIYVSAYGPKARQLAGKVADGAILATGPANPLLGEYVAEVRAAAVEAGRSPDEVEIWIMTRCGIAEKREEALAEAKGSLSSAANYGLASAAQLRTVPPELRGAVLEMRKRYDPSDHATWDGVNVRSMDELGLTDYLAQRFALIGTPSECRDQIKGLAAHGVSHVQVSGVVKRPEVMVERFAEAIIAPSRNSGDRK